MRGEKVRHNHKDAEKLRAAGANVDSTDGEGWKRVVADGESTLPADVFVAMNRFPVVDGGFDEFEERFATRSSTLSDFAGFKGFLLLRRDGRFGQRARAAVRAPPGQRRRSTGGAASRARLGTASAAGAGGGRASTRA